MIPLADSAPVAEYLGVPVRTLDQWAYRKVGPPFMKIGRHRRYEWNAVQAWAESQRVATLDGAAA
jgi:excisionase family DNA binding protein